MKNLKMALMASTAVAALGWNGALAQSVTISSDPATLDEAAITIADGLENFLSGSRQLSTSSIVDDGLVTSDQTIDVVDDDVVTESQSILNVITRSQSRMNQQTTTVEVDSSTANAANVGGLNIAPGTAATAVVGNFGIGAGSLQSITDGLTAAAVDSLIEIDVDSIGISGVSTIRGTQSIADSLANDSVNTVTAQDVSGAGVAMPAGIVSLQTATSTDNSAAATTTAITSDVTTALVSVNLDGDAAAFDITADASVDENVIASRAGANNAVNSLTAGNGDSVALGLGTVADLALAFGTASAGTLAFIADYAVGNVQTAGGAGAANAINVDADVTTGTVEVVVGGVAPTLGADLSARGNSILAEATINTAANSANVTTGGVTGASVGVGSVQSLTGDGTEDITADVVASLIRLAGTEPGEELQVADTEVLTVTGNTIGAEAGGNVATNELRLTSTGALDGQDARVLGEQQATTVQAAATLAAPTIAIEDMDFLGADAVANLSGNAISATGNINRQDNLLVLASLGATTADTARLDGVQIADEIDLDSTVNGSIMEIDVNDTDTAVDGTFVMRDNAVTVMASLNDQTNQLGYTGGSIAGGSLIVNGAQTSGADAANNVAATIGGSSVMSIAVNEEPTETTGAQMSILNNGFTADAAANRQSNLIVASGLAPVQARSQASQTLTSTTVAATINDAAITALSSSGEAVTSVLAGNTVAARSAGNVSTSTISATRGTSFSFTR
ncbi:MAG: beta strand repeat-containing protein [Pikeienuella sp.]|uniref:beta strand repeat-containing protein n=1 Tax=Pikeienuella sp. TaxID=2831957 RepID=UPI003919CB36